MFGLCALYSGVLKTPTIMNKLELDCSWVFFGRYILNLTSSKLKTFSNLIRLLFNLYTVLSLPTTLFHSALLLGYKWILFKVVLIIIKGTGILAGIPLNSSLNHTIVNYITPGQSEYTRYN